MAHQNIFILGATGNVGSELIKQISQHDGPAHQHLNPTVIVGISDSTHFLLSSGGITMPKIINREFIRPLLQQSYAGTSFTSHDQILEGIRRAGLDGDIIFVDVSAEGEKMVQMHSDIIRSTGNRIVTANKKPAAANMNTFEQITANPHRYRYNTTVMAGAGAVPYFQESHGLSETIESVEGTFSGTLAYVCSELEKGEKSFSEIVQEARKKGYTEPHPIDDLSGDDVRRKLLILLRSSGIRIDESDVELHGLINPSQYEGQSSDEFVLAIRKEDDRIQQEVADAKNQGLVPRYIASYKPSQDGKMKALVALELVPIESELGNMKGTANKILIHASQRTPTRWSPPHIIQSPGAGVTKTAAAVRADLLYLLHGTNLWQHD